MLSESQLSELVTRQTEWDWAIIRTPAFTDEIPASREHCDISDITSKDALSRADIAACIVDSIGDPELKRRVTSVKSVH